jgi:hypothetical protein
VIGITKLLCAKHIFVLHLFAAPLSRSVCFKEQYFGLLKITKNGNSAKILTFIKYTQWHLIHCERVAVQVVHVGWNYVIKFRKIMLKLCLNIFLLGLLGNYHSSLHITCVVVELVICFDRHKMSRC